VYSVICGFVGKERGVGWWWDVLARGVGGEGLDEQGVVDAFVAEVFVWVIGSHGKRGARYFKSDFEFKVDCSIFATHLAG
jgi:hypothetical protein